MIKDKKPVRGSASMPDHIMLSISDDAKTTMTVTWRTSTDINSGYVLCREENSGEYFGLYDIFSKGASFLGSALIAAVKLAGGTINIAVALLAVFFALGFVFLTISDRQKLLR